MWRHESAIHEIKVEVERFVSLHYRVCRPNGLLTKISDTVCLFDYCLTAHHHYLGLNAKKVDSLEGGS